MKVNIEAKSRIRGRKSDLKNIRKEGLLPAVIYGEGKAGIPIVLDYRMFYKVYKKTIGELAIFSIDVEGKKIDAIIKDKQIHPVERTFQHLDFLELHPGKHITVRVPLRYTGIPEGVKKGGVLDTLMRDIEVSCLPKDIVEDIEIDISNLDVNEAVHLSDIKLGNLTTKLNPEAVLVVVTVPKKVEEPETSEEEAVEPELVKDSKDTDE